MKKIIVLTLALLALLIFTAGCGCGLGGGDINNIMQSSTYTPTNTIQDFYTLSSNHYVINNYTRGNLWIELYGDNVTVTINGSEYTIVFVSDNNTLITNSNYYNPAYPSEYLLKIGKIYYILTP